MMTNSGMSIFNKYTGKDKNISFKKHYVEHVFWDDAKAVNQALGYDKADSVNIFIPKDKNDLSKYVKPNQYNGVNWTIKEGDFIVRGKVAENVVNGIKDLSKYDDVFTITLVDNKDFGSSNMQHFELKGK